MLVVKISINFSWISHHFDTQFAFVGVQNKKLTNLYLVAAHNETIGGSVRDMVDKYVLVFNKQPGLYYLSNPPTDQAGICFNR